MNLHDLRSTPSWEWSEDAVEEALAITKGLSQDTAENDDNEDE